MGQESSLCVPVSDVPLIGCVKKENNNDDEARAKKDFQRLQDANNNKSDSNILVLSEENTKAITCAHLIASIILKFFESSDNKCDQIGKYSVDEGIDVLSILENILIIGSTPRNYLLKKPICSIDIAVNTRELIKLHLLHLRKYHKTEKSQNSNSKCILWRIYLNKFMDSNKNDIDSDIDDGDKKKYEYIADCNYILNAYFMVEYILKKHISSSLRDKLSIYRDEITKIYKCEIIDTMLYPKYDSYDLDGCNLSIFDITDKVIVYKQLFGTISDSERRINNKLNAIHSKHRIKLQELKRTSTISTIPSDDEEKEKKEKKENKAHHPTPSESISLSFSFGGLEYKSPINNLQRIDSLPAFQFRVNDKPIQVSKYQNKNKNKNLLSIEIPFYEIKLRQVIKLMDFSINTLIIKFSDILELNNKKNKKNTKIKKNYSFENIEDEYKDKFEENNNMNVSVYDDDDVLINYDWTKKIKNGLEGYNALIDFKKKQLTNPNALDAINCHGADMYFWKIIRFGILLSSWNIDKKLICLTKENYHKWAMDILYWNKENINNKNKKNYQIFVDMMFIKDICFNNSLKQYQRMIILFKELEINSKLILIINKKENINFKKYFIKTINNQKKQIIQLFQNQGYDTTL